MRKMFYVGQTICWLALCFVAVFYGWIFRGRQMQAWSIILLVCAGLGYLACLAVGVRFVHNGEVERSEKVLSIIALLPVYVLIALPALFMLLFFSDRGKDGFIFLKYGKIACIGTPEGLKKSLGKSVDEYFREVFRC